MQTYIQGGRKGKLKLLGLIEESVLQFGFEFLLELFKLNSNVLLGTKLESSLQIGLSVVVLGHLNVGVGSSQQGPHRNLLQILFFDGDGVLFVSKHQYLGFQVVHEFEDADASGKDIIKLLQLLVADALVLQNGQIFLNIFVFFQQLQTLRIAFQCQFDFALLYELGSGFFQLLVPFF